MTTEHPEPENADIDDLGLTSDDWDDIAMDYYFGNTEPPEGSVQAAAFERLDDFTRRDSRRVDEGRERGEAQALARKVPDPEPEADLDLELEPPY
jgi:hypothetical protein